LLGGELLDYFKVPKEDCININENDLRKVTESIFLKYGLSESNAQLSTDVLLHADLRGIETHGVSNMLRNYVQMYREGKSNPNPTWKIVKESYTTATVDGDGGLGLMTAAHSMDLAIEKAEKYGMGAVAIKNSGHLGAAGYFAMMALPHDMIGWCMTAGGKGMLPTFGAEPQIGTNPIAIAVPSNKKYPFVFDAAMTSIAGNKIGLLERLNKPILPGWVANPDGSPDMKGGSKAELKIGVTRNQLPLGSTRELGSHKGYGLAVAVDILCGVLSGAIGFSSLAVDRRAHFVAAYKIDGFNSISKFKEDMDEMLQGLMNTKPAPGHERVLYPGLEEGEVENFRRKEGIPLHKEVIDWYMKICSELDIPFKYN
tara:strand:+ start:2218 stop:3327 length:1110 start_codon:yes stop_codon:yes gene_type:complete